jgi:phytoene dehydrogenase-like protein
LVTWWDKIGRHFLDMTLRPLPSIRPLLRVGRAAKVRGGLELAQTMLAPIEAVAAHTFTSAVAQSLIASGACHADLSVNAAGSAPGALILAMAAQRGNMPVPVGGAGRLAEAMTAAAVEAGCAIVTDASVARVVIRGNKAVGVETTDGRAFSAKRAVVADTHAQRLFHDLVGDENLPASFLDALRWFRTGSGMFRMDVALDGNTPWSDEGLSKAGVVHIVGTTEDMGRAAAETAARILPSAPMLVVGQQSIVDATRAPAGGQTLWIETHVPPRPRDGTWAEVRDAFADNVLDRVEKFAPELRSRIVGVAVNTPPDLEARNPNLVDGDLAGGGIALHQQLVFRPARGWFRYATPVKGLYLCSASAHPGGGVHGMGGRNCAHRILKFRPVPGRGK